jgi:hypothetical protein
LVDLNPAWVDSGASRRVGVEFDCPEEGHAGCRVRFYFVNPMDGSQPVTASSAVRLFEREGGGWDTLTLLGQQWHHDMLVGVVDGVVTSA